MRGKRGIMGLAAGVAAVGAVAFGSAQAATTHCTSGTTLAADSYARVYANVHGNAFVCVKATGKTRRLSGGTTSGHFALGGKWVAWTSTGSATNSQVTVMHIPDGLVPSTYPFDTNDNIGKVVVKSDGAAAWAATPSDYPDTMRYVQGTDRSNHPPDQLSDDTKDVKPGTLRSLAGHAIGWHYTDGSTGSANLY